MKLILHHLFKDIRALRWLLLLWILVLLVKIAVNMLVLQPDFELAKRVDEVAASPFLILVSGVVWTILLARLIASEPVTGSRSFWLTRPIGPGVYLPSKLTFIFLLLVVPSLLPTLFYTIQFQSGPIVFKDTFESLLALQLFGSLFIVWLTTYTPGLRETEGTLGPKLVGFIALVLLIYRLSNPLHDTGPMTFHTEILIIGLLASLAIQHGMRRTREGLLIGVVAVLATLAPWPWPTIFMPGNIATDKPVQIDFSPDWEKNLIWSHGQYTQAIARLNPSAGDSKPYPVVQSLQATFQIPGESPVDLLREENSLGQAIFTSLAVLQEKLPDLSLVGLYHEENQRPFLQLFSLDSAAKTRLLGKTGTLSLKLQGRMMSLELRAKIPLNQPHFIAHLPGGFIRVRPLDGKENTSLDVWKVIARKNVLLNSQNATYVLVDPQNRTGTVLEPNGNSFAFSSFDRMDSEVTLRLNGDEPLERMFLYVFEWEPSNEFVSTLTAPDFTMTPK